MKKTWEYGEKLPDELQSEKTLYLYCRMLGIVLDREKSNWNTFSDLKWIITGKAIKKGEDFYIFLSDADDIVYAIFFGTDGGNMKRARPAPQYSKELFSDIKEKKSLVQYRVNGFFNKRFVSGFIRDY